MTATGKPSSLAERFASIRAKSKLNRAKFAALLGVSPNTIFRVEKGDRPPSLELVSKVCNEFGVSLSWLVPGPSDDARTGPPAKSLSHEEMGKIAGEAVADALKTLEGHAAYRRADHPLLPLYDIEGDAPPLLYEGDLPATPTGRHVPNPTPAGDPDAFACQLGDDSMTPEFRQGDILIFSPAADPEPGGYACVRLADTSTFRRVFFPDEDQVRLVALNPHYPELRIPRRDVRRMFRLVWRLSQF